MRHALLLGQLLNRPLLMEPRALDAMMPGMLAALLGQAPRPRAMEDDDGPAPEPPPPYVMLAPGVAAVTISGALARHGGMIDLRTCAALDSYEAIEQRIALALADPAVAAVILVIDSPGGQVSGCFEFGDRLAAVARGSKPIWSIADDQACSAAYVIASATARVWLTETADVGSIGVVGAHCDMSAYDAKVGVKYTYIFSGAHKVDGNPHEPLPEAVRARWTAEFDALRGMFARRVAAWRGLSVDAVLATEAETYTRNDALTRGLADRIGTLDQAVAELSAVLAGQIVLSPRGAAAQSPGNRKGEQMSVANTGGLAPLTAAVANLGLAPALLPAQPPAADAAVPPAVVPAAAAAAPSGTVTLSPAALAGRTEDQVRAVLEVAGLATPADPGAEAAAIVDRCAQAGQPARAADFLGKGMSLAQVRQILNAEEVAAAERTAVSSYGGGAQPGGQGQPPAAAKIDIAAIYGRMNQARK